MKKSAFISDLIFTFLTVSVFTLCLFRFHKIDFAICLLLAVVCGVLAAGAVGSFLQLRRKARFLKRSDEAQKEKLLVHLALLSDEQKTNFFYNFFKRTQNDVRRFSRLRISTEKNFYFLHFKFLPVTADEAAAFSRLKSSKQKILLCRAAEGEAERLCATLGIRLCTGAEVYAMLKAENALPKDYLSEPKAEDKRKRRMKLCFAKSNARRFLFGGALILLTSLLTPFPYYYLVCGSVLLVAAVFIRIFGYA